MRRPQVVNCFHFSVSLGYNTTIKKSSSFRTALWIAFIFLYLWDTTQLGKKISYSQISCELLSFFCIFGIQHNTFRASANNELVVNCFHFSVSLGYNTTSECQTKPFLRLWIAFIFLYLWDTTQHHTAFGAGAMRCELLSFFSIFGIQHNNKSFHSTILPVVNCFHFSVSLGYNTTFKLLTIISGVLWIAFLFQYLWDTTQL